MLKIHNQDGNSLLAAPETLAKLSGTITFKGKGASLKIGNNTSSTGLSVTLFDNAYVEIDENCRLARTEIYCAANAAILLGKRCVFTNHARLYCHEAATIRIGSGCLIASGVQITCSDMHSIIDSCSGERLNPAADITIADRVWIAVDALILKGAEIGEGSILGARATLTKKIDHNCLAVGTPAITVKEQVTWKHALV